MTNPSKALDALEQWQADTRQDIVNRLGFTILDVLMQMGFQPDVVKKRVAEQSRPLPARRKRRRTSALPRAGSVMDHVLRIIRENPGNRGFQILALAATEGHVINERTMRTALNRLRKNGLITQSGSAWFAEESKNKAGQKLEA
jgi:hypothetical protein